LRSVATSKKKCPDGILHGPEIACGSSASGKVQEQEQHQKTSGSLKVQKHSMSIAEACSTRKTSSDALAHILMEVVLTSQAQERTGRLVSFQSQQFRLLNKTKVK
jgi:hypothetical protein